MILVSIQISIEEKYKIKEKYYNEERTCCDKIVR